MSGPGPALTGLGQDLAAPTYLVQVLCRHVWDILLEESKKRYINIKWWHVGFCWCILSAGERDRKLVGRVYCCCNIFKIKVTSKNHPHHWLQWTNLNHASSCTPSDAYYREIWNLPVLVPVPEVLSVIINVLMVLDFPLWLRLFVGLLFPRNGRAWWRLVGFWIIAVLALYWPVLQ